MMDDFRRGMERFAADVRAKRGRRGIRGVCEEIGVSRATISRVECGKLPDLETFAKICSWLGNRPGTYLGLEEQDGAARRDDFAPAKPKRVSTIRVRLVDAGRGKPLPS